MLFGCATKIAVNDAHLEYQVTGSGSQVVLFDAGSGSGMAGWDSIWHSLPDNVTAIRFSRRGEGRSSACTGQLSTSDYVDDVEALLTKLEIQRPFIYVSHSMGGIISRAYAARNPGLVAAMLLVDPANPRDIEIVTTLDPKNGPADIKRTKEQRNKGTRLSGRCGRMVFSRYHMGQISAPGLQPNR